VADPADDTRTEKDRGVNTPSDTARCAGKEIDKNLIKWTFLWAIGTYVALLAILAIVPGLYQWRSGEPWSPANRQQAIDAQAAFDARSSADPSARPVQAPAVRRMVAIQHEGYGRLLEYVQLLSLTLPPLIVLFGLYRARDDLRDAIAGATITAFIVFLGEATLLNLGSTTSAAASLRSTVLTSFLALVGSITLFYFGSEAVIHYGDAKVKEAEAAKAAQGGGTDNKQ
jgi:hypothetical protein